MGESGFPRTTSTGLSGAAYAGGAFESGDDLPDPYADDPKWPAWKVTVFVIVFCGAFWTGIGYLAMRLLG